MHGADYTKFYLPNGIKVVLYERKEIHSVNISVDVNVGALDENSETNGLSHLIEHLPFDGTKELNSWEKVDEFNNKISGSSNAYTSFTHTRYYGFYPYQFLEDALFYLSQLVLHPLQKNEDVIKEKTIVADEMKTQEDTTGQKIYRNIVENRYTKNDSSYTFDIIGTKKTLESFDDKKVNAYYKKYYVPENIELFIVGNFELEKTKKLIKKYFNDDVQKSKYGKKPVREFEKTFPEYSGFNVKAKQKKDLDQYYLTLTFPKPDFKHTPQSERIKNPFLSSLVSSSQYQQSVLWKRLREELGIVYDVSSWGYDYLNRAFSVVETSFSPEHLETVLKEIYIGINKIKNSEVSDIVFETRRKRIIDTELMTYDNASNVLSWIMDQETELDYHNKSMTIKEFIDSIKKLQFSDIIDLSNKIYNWDSVNIGIVSKDNAKVVEKKVNEIWAKITK